MELHVKLQLELERIAEQNRASLATIRYDLMRAIPEVAAHWAERFADPNDVSGSAFCPDVRIVVSDVTRSRGIIPGLTLHFHPGPNHSLVFNELGGTEIRVRKFPADKLDTALHREIVVPPAEQYVRAKEMANVQATQLNLFAAEPVAATSKAEESGDEYDGIYVLWVLGSDGASLAAAWLCMARDVDMPYRTVILAAVELPPETESPAFVAPTPPGPRVPLDDFDAHERRDERTGDDDDPDITPA